MVLVTSIDSEKLRFAHHYGTVCLVCVYMHVAVARSTVTVQTVDKL